MKRYDLRDLKSSFFDRLVQLMSSDVKDNHSAIFIFEIGDFSAISEVANIVRQNSWTLMNSLKYNESDWTVVIKKAKDNTTIATQGEQKEEIV